MGACAVAARGLPSRVVDGHSVAALHEEQGVLLEAGELPHPADHEHMVSARVHRLPLTLEKGQHVAQHRRSLWPREHGTWAKRSISGVEKQRETSI